MQFGFFPRCVSGGSSEGAVYVFFCFRTVFQGSPVLFFLYVFLDQKKVANLLCLSLSVVKMHVDFEASSHGEEDAYRGGGRREQG